MPECYHYRIDRGNILVSLSENWDRFASDNAGKAPVTATNVVGRELDQFIEDDETRALYALILDSVRGSNRPVAFRFRCDSPDERRFCELRITPDADGSIDFESRILHTESRPPVPLLQAGARRDENEILKACSTCKRIAVSDDEWLEIEQAIECLELDKRERTPRISHGICADCHRTIVASL